jgi:hypothetical protein
MGCIPVMAGEIRGTVTDDADPPQPLKKVLVCLQSLGQISRCDKTRSTNKRGQYAFKSLNGNYKVSISSGSSLASRKANPYPNYAWSPETAGSDTQIIGRSTQTTVNFVGGFNFSNFQDALTISALDMPELGNDECLKVYTPEGDLFLGIVTNIDTFSLTVNVPLTTTTLYYDIFCSDSPLTRGQILL